MRSVTQSASQSARSPAVSAHGVWAPAVTPLRADLSIDKDRCVEHIRWLLRQGCHGVTLFGTTGEAPSFSVGERIELLERLIDANVSPDRLMIGTGCCALTDTVRLTVHAAASGCKNVLIMPPFYFKNVSDEGLLRSYGQIIERVGDSALRVFLYHFPQLSLTPITETLIDTLLERYPNTIAGMKDSSEDWTHIHGWLRRYPNLAVFPGSEEFLLDGLRAGARGCISATANINPHGIRAVYDAWEQDNTDADSKQRFAGAVRMVVAQYPLAPALKQIIARHKRDEHWLPVRPPLVSLAKDDAKTLLKSLRFAM